MGVKLKMGKKWKKKKKTFYMLTTKDKYELPLCITESLSEMANKLGVSVDAVKTMISHHRIGMERIVFREGEEGWEKEWEN